MERCSAEVNPKTPEMALSVATLASLAFVVAIIILGLLYGYRSLSRQSSEACYPPYIPVDEGRVIKLLSADTSSDSDEAGWPVMTPSSTPVTASGARPRGNIVRLPEPLGSSAPPSASGK